jgi:hypothetical protein
LIISFSAAAVDFADPGWEWRLPEPLAGAISFRTLDTDRDGALMPGEASRHPTVARHFARGDVDGDGRLSPLEFNNLALELAAKSAFGRIRIGEALPGHVDHRVAAVAREAERLGREP